MSYFLNILFNKKQIAFKHNVGLHSRKKEHNYFHKTACFSLPDAFNHVKKAFQQNA